MATIKLLAFGLLALPILGRGSGEDPSLATPADPSAGATKGAPVTKPSGERVEQSSEAAATNEEHGG